MKLTLAAMLLVSSTAFAGYDHEEPIYLSYCLDNKVVKTDSEGRQTVSVDCEAKGETCQQVTVHRVGNITSFGVCEKQD